MLALTGPPRLMQNSLRSGAGVEDLLGQRRHLGDADFDAAECGDEVVFGAGCFVDLADPAERFHRPGQGDVGDVEVALGVFAVQGVGQQVRQDEVVAGGEDTSGHEGSLL